MDMTQLLVNIIQVVMTMTRVVANCKIETSGYDIDAFPNMMNIVVASNPFGFGVTQSSSFQGKLVVKILP